MFEDWKAAWREAVENFRRELNRDGEDGADESERIRAMNRDLAVAAGELHRIETEIRRARRGLDRELAEAQVCRRRESLARGIGDDETADLAARFAARHAERAGVLERKIEALEAERLLLSREIDEMEAALREQRVEAGAAAPSNEAPARPADGEFRRLEQEERERAAAARLEELKRRMQ